MTKHRLEKQLDIALRNSAPQELKYIPEQLPGEKKFDEGFVEMKKPAKKWPVIAVAAACLALVLTAGGAVYSQTRAVASIIMLDVNPSIRMNVSRQDKILSCSALNDDAQRLLAEVDGGRDLNGDDLSDAVNEVVGLLCKNGYFDSKSSAILISVEDNNSGRASRIEEELTAAVDGQLRAGAFNARVISQSMPVDRELSRKAEKNNISSGKALLVGKAIGLNSSLSFSDLSSLSVEELYGLISVGAPDTPIGRDKAIQVAKDHAGAVSGLTVSDACIEFEGAALGYYRIELEYPGKGELELLIDAYSGEIIDEIWEPDNDADADDDDETDDDNDDDPDDLDDDDDLPDEEDSPDTDDDDEARENDVDDDRDDAREDDYDDDSDDDNDNDNDDDWDDDDSDDGDDYDDD